jgi:cellulose biosynthesis protein BcsQ
MPIGTVTTFYSYKGGVGRTFLLANVAWLLARWGRKVLCLDWDLEAPGLTRYLAPSAPARPGVLDLVEDLAEEAKRVAWQTLREPISGPWTHDGRLDLITAGRQDEDYVDRVQKLDWPRLFEKGLSPRLEELRAEWVAEYDHVLLDSRTGITDIGGICAAQLPDLLVMAFTATHQSLDGTVQVAQRVQRVRAELPLDRGGFWCLPVPSRVHVGEESLLEKEWFGRFEKVLDPLFRPWKDRGVEVREYLQQLRVREYARWSFGEQLPVREERLDDPALVSWAFSNIAALLDHRLDRSGEVSRNRHSYLEEAARTAHFAAPAEAAPKPIDVFISYSHHDKPHAYELLEALRAEGLQTFLDSLGLLPGENWSEALYRAREGARMIVVLLSHHYSVSKGQISEMEHVIRLANERSTLVVPVFVDEAGLKLAPPELQKRFGIFFNDERSWADIARKLTRQLKSQ